MSTATASLYDTDFYGWTQQQAETLRARNFAGLDMDQLIEEVLSMGRRELQALENWLEILQAHLLKWVFQPSHRSLCWQATIEEKRMRITGHLRENPSLKPLIPEAHAGAYEFATLNAARDTGLPESSFPAQCPWTFDQIIDNTFWPETT